MTLPAEDLRRGVPPAVDSAGKVMPVDVRRIYAVLGVGHNRWRRWQRDGLTVDEAETMADRLKKHPSEVWGAAYYVAVNAAAAELDVRRCERDGCDQPLDGKQRRWCSKACANRATAAARMRRYRAKHPEARAYDARYSRAYYQAATSYVKARQRRYDTANADRLNAARRAKRAAQRAEEAA